MQMKSTGRTVAAVAPNVILKPLSWESNSYTVEHFYSMLISSAPATDKAWLKFA